MRYNLGARSLGDWASVTNLFIALWTDFWHT